VDRDYAGQSSTRRRVTAGGALDVRSERRATGCSSERAAFRRTVTTTTAGTTIQSGVRIAV
jgi:hypothetical protein